MLVTLAVLAILVAIAVPNFVSTTQQTRSQVASGRLAARGGERPADRAADWRSPPKSSSNKIDDCGDPVAWAVTQQDPTSKTDKSLSCLSSTDFAKRYKNTALSLEGDASEVEIEFAPTGIGNNLNTEPVVSLASGSKTVRIRFNAGGTTQVL